ncbi:Fc.00g078580.m01.CDS01 [Cosmosporella sp. VM-42]
MATPFRVKALYEYTSPHEDDLKFGTGQVITVTDVEDADWYNGEYVDDAGVKQEGIFPRNFVEKFEPTAPPRPTRTRTKKEPEAAHEAIAPPPPPPAQQEPAPVPEPEPEIEEADEPIHRGGPSETGAPAAPEPEPLKAPEAAPAPVRTPAATPAATKAPEPHVTAPAPAPAPAPRQAPKPKPAGPPPVSDKPASSSFKDRIAAFNKPAAPPIAPFKPSGLSGTGSGFIKKPFVAPPPSRHAFVPPPQQAPTAKVYRRDEDPEIKEREVEAQGQAERAGLAPAESQEGGEEDQPKPTSLKERIALLQRQQQAQRHADAATKKEKPKRPAKKRESIGHADALVEPEETSPPPPQPLERRSTQDTETRTSIDEPRPARAPPAPRRKSSKGPPVEHVMDGNEADMSGAGDTTEGNDDVTERDDSDAVSRRASRVPTLPVQTPMTEEPQKKEDSDNDEEEEEEEEEDEDVDPEVKRKEELRARMAKMSGGMGFHGMFGGPAPPGAPPKKKKSSKSEQAPIDEDEDEVASPSTRAAPPIPTMMALPGMGGPRKSEEVARPEQESTPTARAPPPLPSRQADEEDEEDDEDEEGMLTPAPTNVPAVPPRDAGPPPAVPGNRPAPPPVPSEARPPPPPPPADMKSQTEGSESDDELSGRDRDRADEPPALAIRSPPLPPQPVQPPHLPERSPPMSPPGEEFSPTSPTSTANKRLSRPPPPIPGMAPAPPPAQSRPPPPPPPGNLRRQSTAEQKVSPTRQPQAGEDRDEELTEYEGDYDTDIASSVPHKDALKAHARDSSLEDNTLTSPISEAPPPSGPPPIPTAAAPRAVPPPLPSQPPPPPENKRRSVDVPRAAPPPPPPSNPPPPQLEEDFDPYNYSALPAHPSPFLNRTPKIEEEAYFPGSPSLTSPADRRPPPSNPIARTPGRQSLDVSRASTSARRSMDLHRPSMESGFIANDIDLAVQSGWWKQPNQVPPVLQGRKDIFFESEESTSTNGGQKTTVTREVFVLYQDYSQTFLTIRYDPYDPSDVELEQRHEPPPRGLRQDQMEEFYERFGRPISEAVASKKDTVVGDGTPQGLIFELLRPFKDALAPIGTRAYGALVYSNMANASTQQNDVIRAGDILTVRNAKFQGKHGPMHAKYSVEVGKPDHVAIVSEWDGTKKKVRAWEQGRESKKVKVESFKLDDLRSGEVKIWRVMPRSWVGWNSQP